jgi:hypothetical protein
MVSSKTGLCGRSCEPRLSRRRPYSRSSHSFHVFSLTGLPMVESRYCSPFYAFTVGQMTPDCLTSAVPGGVIRCGAEMDDLDRALRVRAFEFLMEQTSVHGEVLPWHILSQGFLWHGKRVPLIGPQGIFKPAVLPELPLRQYIYDRWRRTTAEECLARRSDLTVSSIPAIAGCL